MSVALVIVGDGRDRYALECVASLHNLKGPVTYQRVVDDSGGTSGIRWPEPWDVVTHPDRRGLAAAVRSAWAALPDSVEFVFHLEADFILLEPVDLEAMADTLDANRRLAQLVLKRQPWSPEEQTAGGIIETCPGAYDDRDGWVEHCRIFSLNPCLIPREVVDMGWPDSNEAGQTTRLVDDGWSFGLWGGREDPPRVLHIGVERAPGWKL